MVLITTDSQDDDAHQQLVAICDSTKNLYSLLKTLDFREHACITVLDDGLRVTVDELRSLQANAYIRSDMFSKYQLGDDDSLTFKVPLHVLCECLNLYANEPGSSTACKLVYEGYGEPLRVILDKSGVITECSIRTLVADDFVPFDFNQETVVTKIIMKCDPLREILSEIEKPCETVQLVVKPDPQCLQLSASARTMADMCVTMPGAMDAIEFFHCDQMQKYSYRLGMLKFSLRALSLATKVSLRIDQNGMLSLQYMVNLENLDQTAFIEFFLAPEEEFDDDF